jgi:hypothetical protein
MKLPKLSIDKLKIKFYIIFCIAYVALMILAGIQIIEENIKKLFNYKF